MKLVGSYINAILYKQMSQVFKFDDMYCHKKDDSFGLLINLFLKILKIKNEKVLIYNTSVINILIIFILKLNRNKVYFHLHDPIPHSGLFNPIIFVANWILVFFSDQIFVFSEKLQKQTKHCYSETKKIHLVSHGTNPFNYKKYLNSKKVIIGFFGRNMPYKNYSKFVSFMNKHTDLEFLTVGLNYPKLENSNHELVEGVIDNDKYYSLMKDVDYLFFSHLEISFSGVLNDAIAFSKSIILDDELLFKNLNYKKKYLSKNITNFNKKINAEDMVLGWGSYKKFVQVLAKNL